MRISIGGLAAAFTAILALSFWGSSPARAHQTPNDGYRVVFQLTAESPEQWPACWATSRTSVKRLGPN